jgi:predicted NAD/FAD-dependent oxidoreductase
LLGLDHSARDTFSGDKVKGDQVEAAYAEGLAIAVEAAPAAK